MKCTVNRLLKSDSCWIGTFEIDGVLKYYTLDLLNVVPPGAYPLTKYFSPAHQKDVPLVNNVPGHSGIEIHVGNFPKDIKGCLLLGENMGKEMVLNSKVAIDDFYPQFFAAIAKGEKCTITYNEF